MQTKEYTATADLNGLSAGEVKPWLSALMPTSPAGQMIAIVADGTTKSYYKDMVLNANGPTSFYGDQSGVIDLRSWFTVTNGFDHVIHLDSVRFYTYAGDNPTDVKVTHLYLSSSASAAYTVTFHKNDGTDTAYTQQVMKNANAQYIPETAVEDMGFKTRDGYIFVGW